MRYAAHCGPWGSALGQGWGGAGSPEPTAVTPRPVPAAPHRLRGRHCRSSLKTTWFLFIRAFFTRKEWPTRGTQTPGVPVRAVQTPTFLVLLPPPCGLVFSLMHDADTKSALKLLN